jgi:peptide/nickel transport system permease protein
MTNTTAQAEPEGLAQSGSAKAKRSRRLSLGAWIGLTFALLVVAVAMFGPYFAPHDPADFAGAPFDPRSPGHALGLDYIGRDGLSRFLWGGRTAIVLAFLGTLLGVVLGVTVGTLAAYMRGPVEGAFNRTTEVLLSLPGLILVLLFLGAFGTSLTVVVLAIGLANSLPVSRIARGTALAIREQPYIEVARARGERSFYIAGREMLPNMAGPIAVDAGLRFTGSVIAVASVSFLGLGLQPPASDWGLMISENRSGIELQPWVVLVPALAIGALCVGVNLFMDGVRRRVPSYKRTELEEASRV